MTEPATERRAEVVRLTLDGLSCRDIARIMEISFQRVNQIQHAMGLRRETRIVQEGRPK